MGRSGYQYTVVIDQAAAERCGLPDDIDDRHLAIMAMCEKLFAWKSASKMQDGENTYFLLKWETVRDRLPRFRLNSRTTIKSYIKRMIEVGILDPHPDNVKLGQPWVRFGEKYAEMANIDPSENSSPRPKNGTAPSEKRDDTRPKNGTAPVRKMGRYNEYSSYEYSNELTTMNAADGENGEEAATPEQWKRAVALDEVFVEMCRMRHSLSADDFTKMLDRFFVQKTALGEMNHTGYSDFRKNFFFWMGKQPAGKDKKANNASNIITEDTYNEVLRELLAESV